MLIVVLISNLLLALLCWWAIWQIWRLRRALAKVTEMLNGAERQVKQLQRFPQLIRQQRLETLRNQYRQTLLSLRQGRQFLSLLIWVSQWSQARAYGQPPAKPPVKQKASKQF